jgi:hypothetical protein
LHKLGLKWLVDLRYNLEIEKHGTVDLSDIGCGHIHAPTMDPDRVPLPLRKYQLLFLEAHHKKSSSQCTHAGPNGKPWATLELGFVKLYLHFLDTGKASFKTVLQHIVETNGEAPTAFHCMSGKDRTGVLAMLIQMIAGVADELIIEDYHLTEMMLGDPFDHITRNRPPSPAFDDVTDEEMVKVASAKPEAMQFLLDIFYRQWGSIGNYCTSTQGLGISMEEFQKLELILSAGPKSRL